MEDEVVIAKSLKYDADVCCFGKKHENEPVLCYIQFIIDDHATGLNDLNSTLVKLFLSKHFQKIEFTKNPFIHFRMGSTVFEELSHTKINEMTADLQEAGILNSFTAVKSAFFIIPNFITEAVNNGLVRFEFGLQIHLSFQNEDSFQFFIQN